MSRSSSLLGLLALLLSPLDEKLDRRRDKVAAIVETTRGLKYRDPVPARAGDRKEYSTLALENAKLLYGDDLSAADRALKSLGLIGTKVRLDLALPLLAGAGRVQAFYRRGELVFVDRETPDDELVYKLTLALMDQRHSYRETAGRIGTDFDAQMALAAVHHGDADMTKQLFWVGRKGSESHPDGHLAKRIQEAETWEGEDSKWASAVAPRLFVRSGDFIWRRGGIFMEQRRAAGGIESVDKVYEAIPPSTEQILHPEKYGKDAPVLVDTAPLEKALAAKAWKRIYRTRMGELGSAVFLETHLAEGIASASPGWGGDTLVTFESGAGAILSVWATLWDSVEDAREFQAAALQISAKLSPEEKELSNLVIRRGAAVSFLFSVPEGIRDLLLEALWTCTATSAGKTEPYGRE